MVNALVRTNSAFRIVSSFRLKEVGKVNREPVAFPRVERTDIAIDRKLDSGFDSNRAVHPEQAGTQKHLFCLAAGHFKVLPLKRAGSLAGELSENAPIPSWVVGAPGKRTVPVNGCVGKQIREAVAFRFRVALVSRAHPYVLTPRCYAGNPADEISGSAVQAPIEASFLWNRHHTSPLKSPLLGVFVVTDERVWASG